MASKLNFIPVSNNYSEGQLLWEAKAKFLDGSTIVKVKVHGQKLLFNSEEILFTVDGEKLVAEREFCEQLLCNKAIDRVVSIGLMVKEKTLVPVLSSVKVFDF